MCFASRRGNEQEVIVVMRPDKRACVPASLMLITVHTRTAAAEEAHRAIATAHREELTLKPTEICLRFSAAPKQRCEISRLKQLLL